MSILTKPKSPKGRDAVAVQATPASSRGTSASEVLVLGGSPRVHLLPQAVIARKAARGLRRRLALGLVGVIIIVALAVAGATLYMFTAQASLASAQSQAQAIVTQRAQYTAVTKVQADVASIITSQKQATAQEITWKPVVAEIQSTMPAGMSIVSITAGIDTPFAAPVASTDPLEGPRLASVVVTVSTPQSSISGWLNKLPSIKGFTDAEPGSVIASTDSKSYTVAVTIHLTDAALANRFGKVK